jgi:predicted phosphoribosyltransferase
MYFASRTQAGRMLADKLVEKYHDQKCLVMALGDGAAIVGEEIARQLNCQLTMLASAEIKLPREPLAIAGITADGTVSYNHTYSDGEIDELVGEYHGFIESEKLTQLHHMHELLGKKGTMQRAALNNHTIVIVSDGLQTGFEIDLAKQFLKPVAITNMVVATPLASVQAVDRMHVLADDLYCLSVIAEYIDTNHYYDQNDIPDRTELLSRLG